MDVEAYLSKASEVINKIKDTDFDAIGAIGNEGICLVTTILHLFNYMGTSKKGFFIRESKKGYGTNKLIEGCIDDNDKLLLLLENDQQIDISELGIKQENLKILRI